MYNSGIKNYFYHTFYLLHFTFFKRQQPVPVIFILLPPCFNLGRQTNSQIVTQALKIIQHVHDTLLNGKRW